MREVLIYIRKPGNPNNPINIAETLSHLSSQNTIGLHFQDRTRV